MGGARRISLELFGILLVCYCLSSALGAGLSDCDPLVPENCLLPFPNSFWLRDSTATETGYVVKFGAKSFPANRLGIHIDPIHWNDNLDGFPTMCPITAYFGNVFLDTRVPTHMNISLSLEKTSPTVLLDAETGERLPHWVELDMRNGPTNPQKLFMMWPAKRLSNNRRYIVGVRDLNTINGNPVEPSFAFTSLRDNMPTTDPNVEMRRPLFKDIFARLEKAGFSQQSLVLAWDFHTVSQKNQVGRLLHMRDDGLSRLPLSGPQYTITSYQDNFSASIFRKITGVFKAPSYLTSPEPGSTLVINSQTGLPVFQSFVNVTFEILVPRSVVATAQSGKSRFAPIVQYGHGLFSTLQEIEDGYLQKMTNNFGWVICSVNMWGVDRNDLAAIAEMLLYDTSNFRIVPDRTSQGMLNNLVLTRLMMTTITSDPLLAFNGNPVIDVSRRYWNGNSQGGIAGNVVMGLSQDLTRGALGVMGGPYSLLLPRSSDFSIIFDVLSAEYSIPNDRMMFIALMQMLWDRADPDGYMSHVVTNNLPNTPQKTMLLQYGEGDAQVTWVGALSDGRSMGAKMFNGNIRIGNETLFGFEFVSEPQTTGALIQGFRFPGVPAPPNANIPANKATDVHSKVREDPRAQAQINYFFNTGIIKNFCTPDGCNPLVGTN